MLLVSLLFVYWILPLMHTLTQHTCCAILMRTFIETIQHQPAPYPNSALKLQGPASLLKNVPILLVECIFLYSVCSQ